MLLFGTLVFFHKYSLQVKPLSGVGQFQLCILPLLFWNHLNEPKTALQGSEDTSAGPH